MNEELIEEKILEAGVQTEIYVPNILSEEYIKYVERVYDIDVQNAIKQLLGGKISNDELAD